VSTEIFRSSEIFYYKVLNILRLEFMSKEKKGSKPKINVLPVSFIQYVCQ